MITSNRSQFSNKMLEKYKSIKDSDENGIFSEEGLLLTSDEWNIFTNLEKIKIEYKRDSTETDLQTMVANLDKQMNESIGNNDKGKTSGNSGDLCPKGMSYFNTMSFYLERYLFNNYIYRLEDISISDGLPKFKISVSDYESFYSTCEYIAAIETKHIIENTNKDDKIPTIALFEKGDDENFNLKCDNRVIGIGSCTLTFIKNLKDENGTHNIFLTHQRSEKLGEAQNTVSMIPAGSFQPSYDKSKAPIDELRKTILREFEEEILGFDEVENTSCYIEGDFPLKNSYELYYLGCGLDPLNTKLEFITLMIIDAEKVSWGDVVSNCINHGTFIKKKTMNEIHKTKNGISFEGLRQLLEATQSKEGKIRMVTYDEEQKMVRRYMNDHNCMPVLREAMRLLVQNKEKLNDILKN